MKQTRVDGDAVLVKMLECSATDACGAAAKAGIGKRKPCVNSGKGGASKKSTAGGAAASDGGKVAVAQHTAPRKQLQLAPVTANAAVARLEHKVQQLEVLLNGEHGVASPFVLMLKLFVLLI